MLEWRVRKAVAQAVDTVFPQAAEAGVVPEVEIPRDPSHGDYATTVALNLARPLKQNPRAIAERLAAELRAADRLFAAVEIAGPGFINLRLSHRVLAESVQAMLDAGSAWGQSEFGQGQKIQVEFVSANPSGPLNVVNARAAAFGGTLVRLLRASGHDAASEFYVNNVGRQIDLLGESLLARFYEAHEGKPAELPEDGYQGEYLAEMARSLPSTTLDNFEGAPAAEMSRLAVERILEWQERDLRAYGVAFDRWFRQSELYPQGVDRALALFRSAGHVEERDGAVWFTSEKFGDDQDRVLVRANGEPTYFLADLAYHMSKHERGFEHVIDIWGPDHHGYIERMQAGMEALGYGREWLEILIVQQVNLLSGGKPVKMSKRKGEFITLQDLIADVGKDTAVFFFLMRRAESHLDFDLDLARAEGDENPVYYVKYAHARISSLLRKAEEENAPDYRGADYLQLKEEQELALIKSLVKFPELIAGAAREREPHRLTNYLREVAQAFHLFYHHCRVVGADAEISRARLGLCRAARLVLANGLALMDLEAPESM